MAVDLREQVVDLSESKVARQGGFRMAIWEITTEGRNSNGGQAKRDPQKNIGMVE